MNVYIVEYYYQTITLEILGVYSTPELADKAAERAKTKWGYVRVQPHIVDKETAC